MNNLTNFIRIVLSQSKLAMEKGEIPIASVIVDPINKRIIGRSFNREIASNKQVYQIHLIPENSQSIEQVFFRLKSILDLSDKKIFSLKKKIAKQKPWDPIIISDNLTWSEFSKINLFEKKSENVSKRISIDDTHRCVNQVNNYIVICLM